MRYYLFVLAIVMGQLAFSQAPTANFTASPLVVCIGSPINFTNTSTAGGSPIVSRTWDFGDGNSSTALNPTHTYSSPGTYTVTLVVTAQNGQADAEVKPAYVVVNPLPTVGFTASGSGCTVPFNVTFTNTSSSGANFSNNWNFGNGQTSTAANPPAVTYATAGNYAVTLTVTNTTTGCSNTFSQPITVSNFSAGISAPTSACVGQSVAITDGSTIGANSWNWNFGDGQTSTSQNPNHTYSAPGTYTITLNSQNTGSGCTGSSSHTITINPLPTPTFTANVTTGCAPLSVNFTNTSGAGTFNWNFGNGNTFTGQNPPAQVYTSNGSYTVTLTMTNANGCVGTTTNTAMINVVAPVVQFSMNNYNGCAPISVQFTDGSVSPNPGSDPLVSWVWNFGDGSPVFNGQVPPPHLYNNVGLYSPTLTVTTQNGCVASITYPDTIQVGSINNVAFTVSPISDCAKSPFDFVDQTTFNGTPNPGEVLYNWDFGDGGQSTQQSPTYNYPIDTGYFDVTLIVDWRGCLDTFTMTNAVYVLAPISSFSLSNTLFCNPTSFPVTLDVSDLAIVGSVPDDILMVWEWGDGTTTVLDDPDVDDLDAGNSSHNYSNYGTYTVEQVIYNYTTGCEDSTTQTIHISQTIAGFALSNDSVCVGSPLTLTSNSTSTHPFGTFSYDMGNGGSTSGTPASYTYSTPGAYTITLTATNNVGCAGTSVFNGLDALARPIAAITPSAVAGCAPITVNYTNASTSTGNGVPLASFLWTFPNASTQTTTNVGVPTSYTFTTEGNFTTTLVATDQFGCVSDPATANMTITKPTADFTLDSVVCDEEVFTAVNGSVGGTSYQWLLDGQNVSVNTNYTSSINDQGGPGINAQIHSVQLIVTDVNGCQDIETQSIVVSLPFADLDYTLAGASTNAQGEFTCPPVFASFTDNSNTYGGISSWAWNFGDGKFSTLQDPNNTYVFAGTYTLNFSIVDEFGCTADTILPDFLTILGPSGNVNWTAVAGVCGQTFDFIPSNLVDVANIIWDLGDGTIVNDTAAFQYGYDSNSTFNPSAILVDTTGCEVAIALPQITITGNGLDAFFQASPTSGPIGTQFVFDESSTTGTSPIVLWEWNMNGTQVTNTTGQDVSSAFAGIPGTYTVNLRITDANGCKDKYALSVTINDEFHLPNIITMNGDGINDLFTFPLPIFKSFDMVILNRWGNVVHQEIGGVGTFSWDGTAPDGTPVNDGVYFYQLTGIISSGTEIQKHGNVTVVSTKN